LFEYLGHGAVADESKITSHWKLFIPMHFTGSDVIFLILFVIKHVVLDDRWVFASFDNISIFFNLSIYLITDPLID